MKKKCSKCKKKRAISQFYKNRSKKDGYDEYCKDCRNSSSSAYKRSRPMRAKKASRAAAREYYWKNRERVRERQENNRLKRKYGMTKTQYKKMLKGQGGACAICGDAGRHLVVDHDHATAQVRGLLCGGCNSGLGFFADSIPSLKKAAKYLEAVKSS